MGHKAVSLRHLPSLPSTYCGPAKDQARPLSKRAAFPATDQSQTRTAQEGRYTYIHPDTTLLDYPRRSHNSDHPSTLSHRPSPISTVLDTEVTSSPDEVGGPLALGPVTARPSLAVWNAQLATFRPPPCSCTGRDKPEQPELPGALHPSST